MMLKTVLRILKRSMQRQFEAVRLRVYCSKLQNEGVYIDQGARILGVGGIKIGRGTIVHKGATITAAELGGPDRLRCKHTGTIVIGEHCSIWPGVIIASFGGHIELGKNVSVNPHTVLNGYGGIRVGDDTRIAAHTVIVASNHVFVDLHRPIYTQGLTGEGIDIGCDVWIGAGVRILDGVKVGDGAVLGAGAVVTKDIRAGDIVAGVPARTIGSRFNMGC